MLVLSREKDQRIVITCPDGTRLEVVCVATSRHWCKIGFEAPREYAVHRAEVQGRIDAEGPKRHQPNLRDLHQRIADLESEIERRNRVEHAHARDGL